MDILALNLLLDISKSSQNLFFYESFFLVRCLVMILGKQFSDFVLFKDRLLKSFANGRKSVKNQSDRHSMKFSFHIL